MIKRRITKKIFVGNVPVGGGEPVTVQSMCNVNTSNAVAVLNQIAELYDAGCQIIRLAVPDKDAAEALRIIAKKSPIPVIADIHFDYRLALQCIENGVHAVRINPGNIGKVENVKQVTSLAKQNGVPIRIGINGGSLEKDIENENISLHEKMVKSAMRHIKILEDLNFEDIVISLKSSDVTEMINAYRIMSTNADYPLHLGVTEAGTMKGGLVKSSIGIGTLLAEGIGDTIRVSLTENPVEEVKAGHEILKSLGLENRGVNFISCPTCGRCKIDLIKLAKMTEKKFENYDKPLTIAVMGCPVNGPGEAKHADFGIAGAINEGYIFKKGQIVKRVPENMLLDEFEKLVKSEG